MRYTMRDKIMMLIGEYKARQSDLEVRLDVCSITDVPEKVKISREEFTAMTTSLGELSIILHDLNKIIEEDNDESQNTVTAGKLTEA